MASYEVPDYHDSDEESDGDILPPRSNQELRLTKLGSAIPIPPQSDILGILRFRYYLIICGLTRSIRQ